MAFLRFPSPRPGQRCLPQGCENPGVPLERRIPGHSKSHSGFIFEFLALPALPPSRADKQGVALWGEIFLQPGGDLPGGFETFLDCS